MAFDDTLLGVGADSQGLLISQTGGVLSPAISSDNAPGTSPGLVTPGPSAGRVAVYYVSSDGDIGVLIAPAPLQQMAQVSNGGVTCNGLNTATQVNRRCELFTSTTTALISASAAGKVCSRAQAGSGIGTTGGTVSSAIQRCEIFSGSGTLQTSGAAAAVCARVQAGTGTLISSNGVGAICARIQAGVGIRTTGSAASEIVTATKLGSGLVTGVGSAGVVCSANLASRATDSALSTTTGVTDDALITDTSGTGFVWTCTPDGDLCIQDGLGLQPMLGVTSDGEFVWVTQKGTTIATGGAASGVQTAHGERLVGSGGLTASGAATVVEYARQIAAFVGSGQATSEGSASSVLSVLISSHGGVSSEGSASVVVTETGFDGVTTSGVAGQVQHQGFVGYGQAQTSGVTVIGQGGLGLLRRVQAGRHVTVEVAPSRDTAAEVSECRAGRTQARVRICQAEIKSARLGAFERSASRVGETQPQVGRTFMADPRALRLKPAETEVRTTQAEVRVRMVKAPDDPRITYMKAA